MENISRLRLLKYGFGGYIHAFLTLPLKKLAQEICDLMQDYHNHNGFQFTADHVINWVSQFDTDDQDFVLEEFLHLLKQDIYISEKRARKLLLSAVKQLASHFKFSQVSDFLRNVEFLRLQEDEGNSQDTLLGILDELLLYSYKMGVNDCGTKSKKYAIYIDDVFATGNTVLEDLQKWLGQNSESGLTNLDEVDKSSKIVIVSVFCLHTWARYNIVNRLKYGLKRDVGDKMLFRGDYKVENHPTAPGQKLNFAYPVKCDTKEVLEYLNDLQKGYTYKMSKREYAMRDEKTPANETFYSSPANRVRFENIVLLKGMEILKKVSVLKSNQRPMGNINPSYQTLGTGTLFFTWRNVSNTTPVVFWWEARHWKGLFPLVNRG